MSADTSLRKAEPSPDDLRTTRLVLLTGAAINLAFWSARRLTAPDSNDPLWQRLLLSTACGVVAAISAGPPRVRALTRPGLDAIAFAGTLWWIHRVAASGLRPEYAIGLFVPPAILSLAFRRPNHHLAYAVFTLAAAWLSFAGIAAPAVSPGLTLACLAAMLVLMHLQIRTRFRVAVALTAGEALRAAISEQTTDAILLVDPDRRAAIECNSRARGVFAVPPGAAIAPLAAAALGWDRLGAAQLDAITAALVHAGTYRGRSTCRTLAGGEFTAELAVRAIRLGRRAVWLVRVSTGSTVDAGASPVESAPDPHGTASENEYRPEELAMYRHVLLAGACIATGLWYLRRSIGLVEADPLWQRLVLSGACVLVAAATAGPPWVRRHVSAGIKAIAYSATVWWIVRVGATGLRPDYAVGLMVVPASIGLGFHRPWEHFWYGATVMAAAAALFLPLPSPGTNPVFVLLCLGMILVLTHLVLRIRLDAYDALLAADDLRHVLFELTSDALVLVDPITRRMLDCNGRARALFGVPVANEIGLDALLALPDVGTTDIVYVMKDISEHGTYRKTLNYAGPGYPGFSGDLAISSMRYAHRQIWLVRIARSSTAG